MNLHQHRFTDPWWLVIASRNGLSGFSQLWELAGIPVDETNHRRNGWSNVVRCSLQNTDGGAVTVFIKRQLNYVSRTLFHPFRGVLTLTREYHALRSLSGCGIATPHLLYFAEEDTGTERRAILITLALRDYQSLDQLNAVDLPLMIRRQHAIAGAALLRSIHALGCRHNCFYPKHVFLHRHEMGFHSCIIDLEKVRWTLSKRQSALRDIRTFFNRCDNWTRSQRLRFLLAYVGVDHVTPQVRKLWIALRKPSHLDAADKVGVQRKNHVSAAPLSVPS